MTTKKALTDEEIIAIGYMARAIESGENGYILPVKFARAIEQTVLSSNDEAIRALLAERDALREALQHMIEVCPPIDSSGEEAHERARAALASME